VFACGTVWDSSMEGTDEMAPTSEDVELNCAQRRKQLLLCYRVQGEGVRIWFAPLQEEFI
jgi:hypothetical protein